MVILGTHEAAIELLEKRSSIYSDRGSSMMAPMCVRKDDYTVRVADDHLQSRLGVDVLALQLRSVVEASPEGVPSTLQHLRHRSISRGANP